ncbi:MAG: serine hydroxymethyltransferase [Deltaproteobacteria bacterium]|nr:serine hydroxymethyltransferase [Deltaproteobacteria bacterium]MDL1960500.1 serine hydroxymethyltransferase [Deltaproteobacteria bacterium]
MIHLKRTDPEVFQAFRAEIERQTEQLEMIASENFVSEAVMQAEGSVFMNKYAEGYPGRRYYGGCKNMDVVERLAIDRLNQLFGSEYANVQPHSGTQANMAVYFAVLNPGDSILSMDLAHGGHLSHGLPASFSGRFFKIVHYGVSRETEAIDYDQVAEIAGKQHPKLIIAGASAHPRTIDFASFRTIADEVGAYLMVDMAHIAGLVASGVHPSPVPFADFITSTTHKTLRGPRGGIILARKKYSRSLNSQVFPGIQGGPLMHIIAAKAVAFKEALRDEFKIYQQQIVSNAKTLAKTMQDRGFRLVSGGTDNHLLLVDLSDKGLTGAEAEEVLERSGITVNKNTIPFDTRSPSVTSGIRIGTPGVTTRGLKEKEMEEVGDYISELLNHPEDDKLIGDIKMKIRSLCDRFPLYSERLTRYGIG